MPITGTYIDIPFASSGSVTPIPDGIQGDGSVSFTQGYGPNYVLPQGSPGALNVENVKMNYLFNLLTTTTQQWQQFTTAPWITHAQNGGSAFSYSKYATVLYTDGHVYESLVNTNTTDPVNDGVHWVIVDSSNQRIALGANTTFYVATTGNDSTGNGTSGTPWLTIQHAINVLNSKYDLAGYTATINVADGTYTTPIVLTTPFVGGSVKNVVINGNSVTPSNVIISTTSADCINVSNIGVSIYVQNLKLQTTTGGSCLFAQYGGTIWYKNIVFGACAANQISAFAGSPVLADGNYSISGSAQCHINTNGSSQVSTGSVTVTITGTPAFSIAFASVGTTSVYGAQSATFSGSATGVRYVLASNGVIYTNGAGATFLPGNSSGTTATGGQYV